MHVYDYRWHIVVRLVTLKPKQQQSYNLNINLVSNFKHAGHTSHTLQQCSVLQLKDKQMVSELLYKENTQLS